LPLSIAGNTKLFQKFEHIQEFGTPDHILGLKFYGMTLKAFARIGSDGRSK
jgi:hypothetical protein